MQNNQEAATKNNGNFFPVHREEDLPKLDEWAQPRKYNALRNTTDAYGKNLIGLQHIDALGKMKPAGVVWISPRLQPKLVREVLLRYIEQ